MHTQWHQKQETQQQCLLNTNNHSQYTLPRYRRIHLSAPTWSKAWWKINDDWLSYFCIVERSPCALWKGQSTTKHYCYSVKINTETTTTTWQQNLWVLSPRQNNSIHTVVSEHILCSSLRIQLMASIQWYLTWFLTWLSWSLLSPCMSSYHHWDAGWYSHNPRYWSAPHSGNIGEDGITVSNQIIAHHGGSLTPSQYWSINILYSSLHCLLTVYQYPILLAALPFNSLSKRKQLITTLLTERRPPRAKTKIIQNVKASQWALAHNTSDYGNNKANSNEAT